MSDKRGSLKVYLGSAPGSGKTFAMLREGRDRKAEGEDVVVGFVETHKRPRTAEAVGNLEVLPRSQVEYKGTTLEEMDTEALIARHPQIALIDELAHTNAPGLTHQKRWQDIEQVREAGIDVITTVNVQHLDSIKDLVENITGIKVHETVPDLVVDSADELQFIDITPQALRKRMGHGNIYPQERIETALDNFFKEPNLAALREIALRHVADHVGVAGVRDAPEDVLVAVSGRATSVPLIRRAVRIARRRGGFASVLWVNDGKATKLENQEWQNVAEQLQCPVIELKQQDIGDAIISVAKQQIFRHIVIGEPREQKGILRRNLLDHLVDDLPDVDIHIIARYGRSPHIGERPTPDQLMQQHVGHHGNLRIYLGYADNCGTTQAMLDEAHRRRGRGTDVVVAGVRCQQNELEGLPVIGGLKNGVCQLDLEALLARNPDVVCVDDLADPTTTGEPVIHVLGRILDAGIMVIATLHLSDLAGAIREFGEELHRDAGRSVIEDGILELADEIELIDITPSALEERMHKRAAAGENPEVLKRLRELAFRKMSTHSDSKLVTTMQTAHIEAPWETGPRLLVCLPPRAGLESILQRSAQVARGNNAALAVLSVRGKEHSDEEKRILGEYALVAHQLDGEFISIYEKDIPTAIANFARENRITEIVMPRPMDRRSKTIRKLIHLLTDVDIHILAYEPV